MSDFHITPELLAAVEKGELPARLLTEAGWSHLMELCPACRDGFRRWQKERHSSTASYEATFQVLPFLIERHAGDGAGKQAQAEKDFRELLRLAPEVRLARIRRANERFRGVLLAELLLAEAKQQMPANTTYQYELAQAAEAVLLRSPAALGSDDAEARAAAYRANALRASGRLAEAEERFRHARNLIRQDRVTDPLVYAEVDWLQGILRKDQRRLAEAEELLTRSAAIYRMRGASTEAARPLLTLGAMYYYQRQDLSRAIATTESALDPLSAENEPRLFLCGRHNLALFLVEAGEHGAAAEMILADEPLYQQFADLWTQLRKIWLLGKIAFGAARFEEAEQAFLAVRGGFLLQGIGYDTAMVSLDLALVYLEQGRPAEVRRLAHEMHALFQAEDIHLEAQAALLLFDKAAREETTTVALVEELVDYLKRARGNPELCFARRR